MIRDGKLDAQNRVALPSDLIEGYINGEKQVIMTFNAKHGCLDVWTMDKFKERYERFENSREIDPTTKKAIKRSYFDRNEKIKIDSVNRIIIPPELKRLAEIEKEVTFHVTGEFAKYFEIWEKGKHKPILKESDSIATTRLDEVTD